MTDASFVKEIDRCTEGDAPAAVGSSTRPRPASAGHASPLAYGSIEQHIALSWQNSLHYFSPMCVMLTAQLNTSALAHGREPQQDRRVVTPTRFAV